MPPPLLLPPLLLLLLLPLLLLLLLLITVHMYIGARSSRTLQLASLAAWTIFSTRSGPCDGDASCACN